MRVRFAPSPTGYLHVGGARTALFNWLWARSAGGTFLLRIEDTDRERSDEAHVAVILDSLRWLGLDWDEGPYFQSRGVERHRADANRLLQRGLAYRDFTTPEELRAEAEARGIGNPSVIARERAVALGEEAARARADAGEPFAIRFRVPPGETRWEDLVHGATRFGNEDIDDLVILRSDGSPTYNMAVVSDDAHMGITHVVRGDDHVSNTPKQILLYSALGEDVPAFAHVPLILGPDGRRLSKRHGATAVGEYERRGILPEAMVNFLALLGWSPGDDREVMGRQELIEAFSIERVLKKSAVFDVDKLEWLNGRHLAEHDADDLVPMLEPHLVERGIRAGALAAGDARSRMLVDLIKVRARTVSEMADQAVPFLRDEVEYDDEATARHWRRDPEATADRLGALEDALAGAAWEEEDLERVVRGLASQLGVGAGKLIHPLRVALTGLANSPGIFEVLVVLGRERALERVAHARSALEGVGETNGGEHA